MGSLLGYVISGVQIIAGIVLTATGNPELGVPLIVAGVANTAGNLLTPKPIGGNGGFEDSPTYGFDSTINSVFEGAPVQIVPGRVKVAPKYISAYTEQDGDDQVLHAALLISGGGRYGISDLRKVWINEELSTSYKGVSIRWWPGTTPQGTSSTFQDSRSIFDDVINSPRLEKTSVPYDLRTELDKGVAVSYSTKVAVDEIALVLIWPAGLYKVLSGGKHQGEIYYATWRATVEYQDDGSSTWVKTASTATAGWSDGHSSEWALKDERRQDFRRIVRIKFSSKKKRTIRITPSVGTESNDGWDWVATPTLLRAEEVVNDDRTYDGYAIMEVEAVASGALSGGFPTFAVEVDGWKSEPLAGGTATFSRNPVRLLREILLSSTDGLGDWVSASDIDTAGTFTTVAAACDALWKNAYTTHTLDLVIDVQQSAQEWIQHICSIMRCALFEVDGVLELHRDQAGSSVRTFDARQSRTSANRPVLMLDDGRADIAEHEIESSTRATHTKVVYFDARDNNYARTETVEFIDPNWTSSDPIVRQEVFLPGITHSVNALKEAKYQQNRAGMRTRIFEWGVGPGDMDLIPMDLVTLYADSPSLSGVVVQLIAVQFDSGFKGRLWGLEYDADVYDDDYQTSASAAKYLTRTEALAKKNALAKGVTDVKVTVLQS